MEQSADAGFIVWSEWNDVNHKHIQNYFARAQDGTALEFRIDYFRPVFFASPEIPEDLTPAGAERKPGGLKTMDCNPVEAWYFPTQGLLKQTSEKLKSLGYGVFESDIHPCDRFLMERFIHGTVMASGYYVWENNRKVYLNPKLEPIDITPALSYLSLDIETNGHTSDLYSIAGCFKSFWNEKTLEKVFMLDGSRSQDVVEEDGVWYCRNEKILLQNFSDWLQELDPDVLIGWHVIGFDLRSLQDRCQKNGLAFNFGRNKRPSRVYQRESGDYVTVPGRVVLDGPVCLRSSFYTFEDFKLNTVAHEILGEGKLIEEEDGDKIESINNLFKTDKKALAAYNLTDCRLVLKIFEKSELISLLYNRVKISGMLLEAIGKSAAAFDFLYLPKLHRKGYVALDTEDILEGEHSAGGFVMEPRVGRYQNVLVLDFKSLYPSIIMTFKIDPLSRALASQKPVETPVGVRFSSEEHILPQIIMEAMNLRAKAKKLRNPQLSQAIKILMNSFYGVMGSFGCRFYHPDLPASITGIGRWLLKNSAYYLEDKGYEVIYGDTDSLFVVSGSKEIEESNNIGTLLSEDLNGYWEKRLSEEFKVYSYLDMEFEKLFLKFHLPSGRVREGGAKKRYAGMLHTEKGPELHFVGMESVRTDWTLLAKNFQHELYIRFFNDQPLIPWMRDFVQKIYEGRFNSQLVYKKRIRKNLDEYVKNVPPQIKAAKMLGKNVKEVQYVMTQSGPVPIQFKPANLDYKHYVYHQILPIADSVLEYFGEDFENSVLNRQQGLFD